MVPQRPGAGRMITPGGCAPVGSHGSNFSARAGGFGEPRALLTTAPGPSVPPAPPALITSIPPAVARGSGTLRRGRGRPWASSVGGVGGLRLRALTARGGDSRRARPADLRGHTHFSRVTEALPVPVRIPGHPSQLLSHLLPCHAEIPEGRCVTAPGPRDCVGLAGCGVPTRPLPRLWGSACPGPLSTGPAGPGRGPSPQDTVSPSSIPGASSCPLPLSLLLHPQEEEPQGTRRPRQARRKGRSPPPPGAVTAGGGGGPAACAPRRCARSAHRAPRPAKGKRGVTRGPGVQGAPPPPRLLTRVGQLGRRHPGPGSRGGAPRPPALPSLSPSAGDGAPAGATGRGQTARGAGRTLPGGEVRAAPAPPGVGCGGGGGRRPRAAAGSSRRGETTPPGG